MGCYLMGYDITCFCEKVQRVGRTIELKQIIIIMAICIAPVSLMALLHIKHHVKTILLMPIKRPFLDPKK